MDHMGLFQISAPERLEGSDIPAAAPHKGVRNTPSQSMHASLMPMLLAHVKNASVSASSVRRSSGSSEFECCFQHLGNHQLLISNKNWGDFEVEGPNPGKIHDSCRENTLGFESQMVRRYDWTPKTYLKLKTPNLRRYIFGCLGVVKLCETLFLLNLGAEPWPGLVFQHSNIRWSIWANPSLKAMGPALTPLGKVDAEPGQTWTSITKHDLINFGLVKYSSLILANIGRPQKTLSKLMYVLSPTNFLLPNKFKSPTKKLMLPHKSNSNYHIISVSCSSISMYLVYVPFRGGEVKTAFSILLWPRTCE